MCAHENAKCIDTRKRDGYRYRRYSCKCGHRFSTVETEVDCDLGGGQTALKSLKKQFGLSQAQTDAITNLIAAFEK